jgi:TP901 family phage tail tape measure protein
MPAISQLFTTFGLKTEEFIAGARAIQRETKAIEQSLKPLKQMAEDVGKAMSVALTVPLAGIGTAAVAATMKLDEAMDHIRAGTGATGKALETLGQDFRSVLGTVPNSIEQVSNAITDLATRTGLAGKPLQDLATQELNLARLTKSDVGETIQATTRVFENWNVATDRQSASLDYLFKISQTTGVKVNALSQAMVDAGAQLRDLGFSFNQSAALIGQFEKAGVNTEGVLKAMGLALKNMAKVGITDSVQAFDIITQKIKQAGSAAEANEIGFKVFGKSALAMVDAIRAGRLDLTQLTQQLDKSSDTINKAAKDTLSFSEKLDILKNKAALALEPIGARLLDSIERLMPTAEKALGVIAELAEQFSKLDPATRDAVIGIGAVLAVMGPALVAFSKLSKAIAETIVLLKQLAIIESFGAALSALPLLATIRNIGDLKAGIALLGETGIVAQAGLVGLAAGIGVAIGMFVNWTLKITGLQTAFDGWLKSMVEWIPILGKWATGQSKVEDSTKGLSAAQARMVEELNKRGIAVDKARLGDAAYTGELGKQMLAVTAAERAAQAHADATNKLGNQQKKTGNDIVGLNKLLGDQGNELEKLIKEFNTSLKPADDLNKELTKLIAAHMADKDIVAVYAEKIVKAVEAQKAHGYAVSGDTERLYNWAVAAVEVTKQSEEVQKAIEKLKNAFDRIVQPISLDPNITGTLKQIQQLGKVPELESLPKIGVQVTPTIPQATDALSELSKAQDTAQMNTDKLAEKLRELNMAGIDAKLIDAQYGDQLERVKENAQKFGTQLDANTKAAIRNHEAIQQSAEQAKKWRDVWVQAMGNVTSQFADGVAKMIFESGKFSFDIKGIFKELGESIVKMLVTDAFTKIAKGFEDLLGGMLSGVTGGLGKKLGDALGGLLHIGGGAASAGTSAATSATGAAGGLGGLVSGGGGAFAGIGTGLISGGIAAAGSLLGSMRLEGTMNAVEANTRFTYIELLNTMNSILWPMKGGLDLIVDREQEQINQLDAMYNVLNARLGRSAETGPAGTIAINYNVGGIAITSSGDARTIRDTVVAGLQTNQDEFLTKVTTAIKQAFPAILTVPSS